MSIVEKKLLKTKNIEQSLKDYAEENSLSVEDCDFNIHKVDSYVKESTTNDFSIVSKDTLKTYTNKEKILNEHIEFNQVYTISINTKEKDKKALGLNYELVLGKYISHPKLILKSDSKIPYKKYKPLDILRLIYTELNKIKAYHSMVIHILDEDMKKTIKAFVKHLYAGKFVKNVKIPLFNGIEPLIAKEGKLIYWFKEKDQQNKVIEVEEGEILIEYKKPIFSKNGLNAYGKEIYGGFSNNSEDLSATVDSKSIKIEENEKSKLYKSKLQGYVHFNQNSLSVDNKIRMANISRNNATVASQEENNIEVRISQNDTTKDSIGEGVELVSETIHVNGHIGAKSILEAVNLQIDGVTHQNSKQYAKFANINRHKGKLRCHQAKITLLEGGEVHATSVEIESCLGGSVYAQNVTIGLVKNNLKVYASDSITIRHVSGEDNLFKINYRDVEVLNAKITMINEDIDDLNYKLDEAKKHTQANITPLKQKISQLKREQNRIYSSYKHAKITIQKPLTGLNKIVFVIDNENEISYKTLAQQYTPFYLEIENDTITLLPTEKSISIH